jgi:glycine/sarcosine N-methyltransferase
MPLYASLAPRFDDLFPAHPKAAAFLDELSSRRQSGRLALDAGCATGAQALALAALGWTAFGVDTESAMIDIAKARALSAGLAERSTFIEADILDLEDRFSGKSFDLILCLGNTLPHLLGDGAESFLAQARRLLVPDGSLVVQTINYALPGIGPGFIFPELKTAGARLRRHYASPPPGHPNALRFVTELELEAVVERGETILQPLSPMRIESLLREAGFGAIHRVSGWDGRPFDEATDLYCVTIARL